MKRAFTLAEFLITLGIIGVVAALTLPSVIQKVEDMHLRVLAKKIYSETAQIIEDIQNEGTNINDFRTGYAGNLCMAVSKYFTLECGIGTGKACNFSGNVSKYRTLDKTKIIDNFIMDDGNFTTRDNRMYFCEQQVSSTNPNINLFITVDINGSAKPNILGRDLFTFWIDQQGFLKPMGSDDSLYPANKYCSRINSINSGSQGFGCMYNVLNNINY